MFKSLRRWKVLVCCLLATAAMLSSSPSPTFAASCKASPSKPSCDFKEPYAESCVYDSIYGNAFDVETVYLGSYTYLVLRYSPSCRTNWARLYTSDGVARQVAFRVQREDDHTASGWNKIIAEGYTFMLYAPTGIIRARACGQVAPFREWCTDYH
jgi:hypothetical protein